MVLITTVYLATIICALSVVTTENKHTRGDIEHGEVIKTHSESVVEDNDTVLSRIETEYDNLSLNQSVNIDYGQIEPDDDSIVASDTDSDISVEHGQTDLDVIDLVDDDRDVTNEQQKEGVDEGADEGADTFVDEELQQDLPDLWSDTGQFLSGILDTPIRHSDPDSSLGVKVGSPSEVDAVECPPPVVPVTPSLCGAPACLTHRHCRDPDTACCFNGCVHTCLRPLDAPAVIDWLEDTSLLLPMLDEAPGVPRFPIQYEGSSSIAYARGGGEAVHLQGGCTITSDQYQQLKDYMTRTTIQDCSCTDGEVVCAVKPYKAEEE